MILVKGNIPYHTLQFEQIFEEVNQQSQFIFHLNITFKKLSIYDAWGPVLSI